MKLMKIFRWKKKAKIKEPKYIQIFKYAPGSREDYMRVFGQAPVDLELNPYVFVKVGDEQEPD